MTNENHIIGLENVPDSLHGGALSIGNFDGVHRGHRRIFARARALADAADAPVVGMTFDPPPDRVLRPGDVPERLTTAPQRAKRLLEAGCDAVVTVRATAELFQMNPDAFIEEIIVGRFDPRHIVEGPNFFFGLHRSGTVASLQEAAERYAFDVHVVDALFVELDGEPKRVSSTLIRNLLLEGRVEAAADLLASPYEMVGPIVGGKQLGRVLQYPTANLDPGEQVIPGDGVYAGWAVLEGRRHPAAVSIGNRPTFGPGERAIEANLLDLETTAEHYGKPLSLQFLRRLRDQQRFRSPQELREQIEKDVQRTRELLK